MDGSGDIRVRNTVTFAAALGIGLSSGTARPRRGSSEVSQGMAADSLISSDAAHSLQATLADKIEGRLSLLQQSIEAIGKVPERGVSILNILRQSEIPVMTLLDKLRDMPANGDPLSFLKEQGFPEILLERLGLCEGMSKSKCQEILSRHLQNVLEKVGINSGVRSFCKLAVHGEDYYRNLSSGLKLCSTIAEGISNIAAKPIALIARAFGRELSANQEMAAMAMATTATVILSSFICPPLAVGIGVAFATFLIFKGLSTLFELIDQSFARNCLEMREGSWNEFFSNLSQKISKAIDDIAPAAMAVAGNFIPGAGQVLQIATQRSEVENAEQVVSGVTAEGAAKASNLASGIAGQVSQVVGQTVSAAEQVVSSVVTEGVAAASTLVQNVAGQASQAGANISGALEDAAASEVPSAEVSSSSDPKPSGDT
jgi:hypothetical protein